MVEKTNHNRRRFLATGIMAIASAELGMIGSSAKVTRTVRRGPTRVRTRKSSRASIRTDSSKGASGTICLRKRRGPCPGCPRCRAFDERKPPIGRVLTHREVG
jgi:hypothetical protein